MQLSFNSNCHILATELNYRFTIEISKYTAKFSSILPIESVFIIECDVGLKVKIAELANNVVYDIIISFIVFNLGMYRISGYPAHFSQSGIWFDGFVTQLSGIRPDIMLVSGRIPDNCTFSCNKQLYELLF